MKTKLFLATFLLIASFGFSQSTGPVMITEFLPDPSGTEKDREWFEIKNMTNSAIDLNGWTFQDRSSSSRTFTVTGTLMLPANGYLVFGNSTDTLINGGIKVDYAYNPTASSSVFNFNNSNSFDDGNPGCNSSIDPDGMTDDELDGLVILDTAMTEIDRMEYDFGYNNTNLLGSGKPDGMPNLQTLVGWDTTFTTIEGSSCYMGNDTLDDDRSIQKISNTGNVMVDWVYSNNVNTAGIFYGTPGKANSNAAGAAPGSVVINEFLPDPSGNEREQEWFELMNTTSAAIDLNGWTIQDRSSSSRTFTITGTLMIPANGFLVFGNTKDKTLNGGINVDYEYNPSGGSSGLTMNNSNSFDDGPMGCNSSIDPDGMSDDELDGIVLLDATMVEIDRLEYDFGYNNTNLTGSGKPDGMPNLQTLAGWDSTFTMIDGSSCYNGNDSLDDNRSIQRMSFTSNVMVDWEYSIGNDTAGIFYGTPGKANVNTPNSGVSVSEIAFADDINIYPNPTKNGLITIKSANNPISGVEVYNVTGQLIFNSLTDRNQLDLSGFGSGVYLVRILSDDNSVTRKLIVE